MPMDLEKAERQIKKLCKVIAALTQLALEIGSLIAVIRFIVF